MNLIILKKGTDRQTVKFNSYAYFHFLEKGYLEDKPKKKKQAIPNTLNERVIKDTKKEEKADKNDKNE
jgi:hypothetical protein